MASDEVEKELQFHIDQRASELIAAGRAPDEARRQARLEFGGMLQVQEACREARQSRVLASLTVGNLVISSVNYATKQFRESPLFTAAAVLTLALGIGGTTAIVTLIDAVMLRPLPVSDPARLYRIGDGADTIAIGRHGRWGFFSFPLYERLRAAAPEFEDITAFGLGNQLSVRKQGAKD